MLDSDDAPAAVDDRLLLELMILVHGQAHDREETGSVERAHVRRRTDDAINAHFDHLAGLGLITARVVPGYRRRVCALTEAGRAWCDEHFDAIIRGDY